ncbi:hypothetical protein FV395_23300 [Salmonella enterica]|nr:hypothetical protein [Salmonella enterica]
MLTDDAIKNSSEFAAFCSVHGRDFVKICNYLQEDYRKQIFTVEQREQAKISHKFNNLSELITLVQNAAAATAPIINI